MRFRWIVRIGFGLFDLLVEMEVEYYFDVKIKVDDIKVEFEMEMGILIKK